MSAAAASGNNLGHASLGIDIVSSVKGEMGNLLTVWALVDPAGATGASTLVETGNSAYVKLKNAGAGSTATLAEMITAFNSGSLVTATLHAAATGANTGVAFTGTVLSGGASGANGYDDLAAATGDGWTLKNVAAPGGTTAHGAVDVLTKVNSRNGSRHRVTAEAATGATNVVQAAYNTELRFARNGYPRTLKALGATGANEYVV